MNRVSDDKRVLYTVGHSNHEMPAFIELLDLHGISVVADVRSSPYSRYSSQFNRGHLEAMLKQAGIGYVFLGEELGARRSEPECLVDGKVRFDRVPKSLLFEQGVARLAALTAEHRVALMCSEKDPITCHRTILICRNLRSDDLEIRHILEDGSLETQTQAEDRLLTLWKLPPGDLFDSKETFVEEAYNRQGERIAYTDSTENSQEYL
ncbi:MAG TPA: DUF488 domain-containing protein [Thermoguttaceae bacterium]|nr:DUF488 domain-containing protein [Thermoguttaceae bacterium]